MSIERELTAGTKLLFGVPAHPMPGALAVAIGRAVSQVPGILEAYLPQCHIEGGGAPRQVLVLCVESEDSLPTIMQDLMPRLEDALPRHQYIDIMPFTPANMPCHARVMECAIWAAPAKAKKPWWKFW